MHRETKGLHGDTWDGNAAQTTKNASGFPRGPPGVPRAGANCDGFGVPTALLRTRHGVLCRLPRPQYLVIGTVASHHIWVVRRGQRHGPPGPGPGIRHGATQSPPRSPIGPITAPDGES